MDEGEKDVLRDIQCGVQHKPTKWENTHKNPFHASKRSKVGNDYYLVADTPHGAYLLKKFVRYADKIVLKSINSKYSDIPLDDPHSIKLVAYSYKTLHT